MWRFDFEKNILKKKENPDLLYISKRWKLRLRVKVSETTNLFYVNISDIDWNSTVCYSYELFLEWK